MGSRSRSANLQVIFARSCRRRVELVFDPLGLDMMQSVPFTAFVSWPSAPLTNKLVLNSLAHLDPPPKVVDTLPLEHTGHLLQWSTYDAINHDLTHENSTHVLSSSYTIRKALIRKHYLSRCTHNHLVKHPESSLKDGIPRTWELELSFADELEDMWGDELYDLGDELESGDHWFILKPGMADRGMGIRLFHTKEELEQIFLEFEDNDSGSEDEDADDDEVTGSATAVATSQLRHFVIQVCTLHSRRSLKFIWHPAGVSWESFTI